MSNIPNSFLRAEVQEIFKHNIYAVRISKVKNLNLLKTFNVLKEKFSHILLVIEQPDTPNAHIQGFVGKKKTDRDAIASRLAKLYPDMIGQKTHTIKPVRKQDKIISYTLKDSENFRSKGVSLKLLKLMKKMSIKKDGLNKKLDTILEDLFLKEITMLEYQTKYVKIISDHGQLIYINHIKAHFNRVSLRTGQIDAKGFVLDNFYPCIREY